MAQKGSWMRRAKRVIGVDILDYRLSAAKRTANSETINAEKDDPVQTIRDMTDGRGADVCVDAVGMEAERKLKDKLANIWHVEVGTIKELRSAISAVRRGGWIRVLGVYGVPDDKFPMGQIFGMSFSMSLGSAANSDDFEYRID